MDYKYLMVILVFFISISHLMICIFFRYVYRVLKESVSSDYQSKKDEKKKKLSDIIIKKNIKII